MSLNVWCIHLLLQFLGMACLYVSKTEILIWFESKLSTVAVLLAKVSTLSPKVTVIKLEFWCNKKNPNAALKCAATVCTFSINPFAYFWLWKAELFEKIFWINFWSNKFFQRQFLGSFYRYSNTFTYDIYLILYFLNAFMQKATMSRLLQPVYVMLQHETLIKMRALLQFYQHNELKYFVKEHSYLLTLSWDFFRSEKIFVNFGAVPERF